MLAHQFNHDVCLTDGDLRAVLARWPTAGKLMLDRDVAVALKEYERAATRYKARVQRTGTTAVALAVIALSGSLMDVLGVSMSLPPGSKTTGVL